MEKFLEEIDNNTQEELGDDEVVYCNQCLSLAIRTDDNLDYCDKCGSTNIGKADIKEWELMYELFYKESYLNKK